ncbi:hypothetical protein SAMN04487884_12710 [Butyrivibrio fibrisolvens]|uniref:Uncharacterized protein n=1 Tax=Butyrivibrio fibrisolvens TaxID=831 RepID=A0A1H9W4Z1_BUTFI|nr:hypothetical protein [Butyrivibrio fibrisolvens]SES28747.1 hypothetical protein SAMN04487884_12710 [Butyrivibrio fibrisolvens]
MANTKEYDSFKTQDGIVIYLYQAINANGEWNNLYAKHPIFCPECGVAPLKFTSKTSSHCAYLSSMPIPPNTEHSDDCSHRYRTIGKRGAKEFYDNCTDDQATDKINACINLLKRRNFIMAIGDADTYPHHPKLYVPQNCNSKVENRRLRTWSFYSIYKLDEEDMGIPIVFYGNVFLSFERVKSKTSDFEFNVLKVISIYNNRHQLQSIFLGQQEIDVEENHPYLFSMLGIIEKNGKYNNVKFYNQYHPLFRIEDPDD